MPSSGRGGELPFQTQHTPLVTVLFMGQDPASYKHRLGAGFQEPWASNPLFQGSPAPQTYLCIPSQASTWELLGSIQMVPGPFWSCLPGPSKAPPGPCLVFPETAVWCQLRKTSICKSGSNGSYFTALQEGQTVVPILIIITHSLRLTKLASFKHRYLVQSI